MKSTCVIETGLWGFHLMTLTNMRKTFKKQRPTTISLLAREIMKSSRLRNNFLQKKTEETHKLYVRQRNRCVSLLKKAKKESYQNLDEKNVIDNKKFWKTVKPLLSDKSVSREKINLTENEKMLTSESETADTSNIFFLI